jgi:hypothetical protein
LISLEGFPKETIAALLTAACNDRFGLRGILSV